MIFTNLNLSALQYFIDAVELGSLTLAAEKNRLTRPGVSVAIRRIEAEVGFNLIEHSKNKLELTEKGADFFQKAKKGLSAFEGILSEKTRSAQPLRIACSATIAEFVLIPALRRLKTLHTQIQIRIGTTSKVRQLIEDSESNLGLVIDDNQNFKMQYTRLRQGKFVLLSKTGEVMDPIITTEERPEVTSFWRSLGVLQSQNRAHMQIESWSIGKKMAIATGGTCLIPDIIPPDSLKEVKTIKIKSECNIIAIYKDKNFLSEEERKLLDVIQLHD